MTLSTSHYPFFDIRGNGGWVTANLVGGIVAGILETELQFLGTLVLAGLPIAAAQGICLRRCFFASWPDVWRWVLIVAIGWPLGHFAYVSSSSWTTPLVQFLNGFPLVWEVFGINVVRLGYVMLLIGTAQWLVVGRRHQAVYRDWGVRWILVSMVAGALLGGSSATLCRFACDPLVAIGGSLLVGTILGAAGWVCYALITVRFLPFILRRST